MFSPECRLFSQATETEEENMLEQQHPEEEK